MGVPGPGRVVTAPAKPVTARINEHIFLGGRHIGGLRLPLIAVLPDERVVLDGGNGIYIWLPRTAVILTGGHP
jgi:hypothetical protein